MAFDHLGGGDGEEVGHLGEVVPVVVDVDHHLPGIAGCRLRVPEPADCLGEELGVRACGIEADQHGAGGGDEFGDAAQVGGFEAVVQSHRRAQVRAFDEEVALRRGVEGQGVGLRCRGHWR